MQSFNARLMMKHWCKRLYLLSASMSGIIVTAHIKLAKPCKPCKPCKPRWLTACKPLTHNCRRFTKEEMGSEPHKHSCSYLWPQTTHYHSINTGTAKRGMVSHV